MSLLEALRRLGAPAKPPPAPRTPEPKAGPCLGNCYVTCEALYHLLGGKQAGYTPHTVTHEGGVHWYLVKEVEAYSVGDLPVTMDIVVDPTASQFKTTPDYTRGRGRGFLTKQPSKRARALMDQLVWQYPSAPARSTKRRTT